MSELMYSSQQQQQIPKPNPSILEKKRLFDETALDCIITDGRSFGDLRRPRMARFLNILYPG